MEITYQRNVNRNYMILEGQAMEETYEESMLAENHIKALLSFYTIHANGKTQYWYDITGLHSLRDFVSQEGVEIKTIYQIIVYLGIALDEINRYLLSQERLLLGPDTVFLSRNQKESDLVLCYCPVASEDFTMSLLSIMELFLTEVDHNKIELTKLCYALYERVAKGDVRYEELTEMVCNYDKENAVPGLCKEEEAFLGPGADDREADDFEGPKDRDLKTDRAGRREVSADRLEDCGWDELGEEEEEEKGGVREIILHYFSDLWSGIRNLFSIRKKYEENIRQDRLESIDDFIYDPSNDFEEATTILKLEEGSQRKNLHLIYEGEDGEDDFRITSESFRIGSMPEENDGVIHAKAVSRHHARIRLQGQDIYLEDLNSTNGTFLNGKVLSFGLPVRLSEGDKIRFADQSYRLSFR
jgi:hypothetical protein